MIAIHSIFVTSADYLKNHVFRWPGASLCIQITSYIIWRPTGIQKEILIKNKEVIFWGWFELFSWNFNLWIYRWQMRWSTIQIQFKKVKITIFRISMLSNYDVVIDWKPSTAQHCHFDFLAQLSCKTINVDLVTVL